MSERTNFRGRGGGPGGRGRGSGRGGARDGAGAGHQGKEQTEKPKKENILDLNKYVDKEISVKFSGGREGSSAYFYSSGYNLNVTDDFSHWCFERV